MPGPADDFIIPTNLAPYGLVPTGSPASVTSAEQFGLAGYFFNPTSGPIVLYIVDGTTQPIVTVEIPALTPFPFDTGTSRFTGVRWSANLTGLYGGLTGWPTV